MEDRIFNETLSGDEVGRAITDTYEQYLRLAGQVDAQGYATVDQERAAARLISLIGDLGHVAGEQGAPLSPAEQALVRQSRAFQASSQLPDIIGAAGGGGGILAARARYGPTRPTGTLGGRPIGEPEATLPNADTSARRGVRLQNEAADRLAEAGYRVERLPRSDNSPSPDLRVEGRVFDVYSPEASTSARNIVSYMGDKYPGQTDRVVLNLAEHDISRHELRAAFTASNTGIR